MTNERMRKTVVAVVYVVVNVIVNVIANVVVVVVVGASKQTNVSSNKTRESVTQKSMQIYPYSIIQQMALRLASIGAILF